MNQVRIIDSERDVQAEAPSIIMTDWYRILCEVKSFLRPYCSLCGYPLVVHSSRYVKRVSAGGESEYDCNQIQMTA